MRNDDVPYFLLSASSWLRRVAERRLAEERERQEWLADVKRRLGLVCTGDGPVYLDSRAVDYWPMGVPLSQYTVISDHRMEVPLGWSADCLCVLLDGERVALGGPCPVHAAA